MGLFDKKYCDICNEKIGLLGNKKVEDGNICKDCAKKLSPWFTERRHSTLQQIKDQLQYREENKNRVKQFKVTMKYDVSGYYIFIDKEHGWFAVGSSMDEEENPDIINASQLIRAGFDISDIRTEVRYRDKEGEYHSYSPRRYKYSYDYYVDMNIQSEWFNEIRVKLNTFSVEEEHRSQAREYERLGDEIVRELTNLEEKPDLKETEETWVCSCGTENKGKFCMNCGKPKMENNAFVCPHCGWKAENIEFLPKFCPECGKPMKENENKL